jgi:hypothetical protein
MGNMGHWGGVGWGYPYSAVYPDGPLYPEGPSEWYPYPKWAVFPEWSYPNWDNCSRQKVMDNCPEECKKGVERCKDCFSKNC